MLLQSFGFFSFDCFRLIVVDNFVSVDVILLPKLLFVVVEEPVGAVLELHAVHPQAGVRQPAQVGADQPGLAGHLLGRGVKIRAANDASVFTITEKASTRPFSWLKAATSFYIKDTIKTLC